MKKEKSINDYLFKVHEHAKVGYKEEVIYIHDDVIELLKKIKSNPKMIEKWEEKKLV